MTLINNQNDDCHWDTEGAGINLSTKIKNNGSCENFFNN